MTTTSRALLIAFIPLTLLLLPLIGMQVSDEVNWSTFDFMVGGALLLGIGSLVAFITTTVKKAKVRWIMIAVALLMFLLVWAELAVGVFGTPFAGS